MPKGIYKRTVEMIANISASHMGQVPWNKGKTGIYSKETLEKISKAATGRKFKRSLEYCKNISLRFKGKPKSEEAKQKMRENHPHLKGNKHPRWKGGRIEMSHGYVGVYSPNHPYRSKANYVLEHRLIVEASLGRFLEPKEVVHHKNGIRNDNRIENLSVMSSADHCRVHKGKNGKLTKQEKLI